MALEYDQAIREIEAATDAFLKANLAVESHLPGGGRLHAEHELDLARRRLESAQQWLQQQRELNDGGSP